MPEGTLRSVQAKETGFGIDVDSLNEIVLEKDVNVLSRYGGVKGVLRKLRSDLDSGLSSDVVSGVAGWG